MIFLKDMLLYALTYEKIEFYTIYTNDYFLPNNSILIYLLYKMCIICQTPDISSLINLTGLDCSYCPLLTSIPDTLINLINLYCHNCPLLTSIPSNFIKLIFLNCDSCSLLTSIPSSVVYLICYKCPWIDSNKTKNIQKLITIQRFIKNNIKYRRFSRWIKSKTGIEWIYHPNNIGGIIAKREIERMFE
jgi:hypothetical protein